MLAVAERDGVEHRVNKKNLNAKVERWNENGQFVQDNCRATHGAIAREAYSHGPSLERHAKHNETKLSFPTSSQVR